MKKKLSNILIATIVLTTVASPVSAQVTATPVVQTTVNASTDLTDLHLADAWAREAIIQAKATGLMNGDPSGQFRPQDTITRQEIAVVLTNALGLTTESGTQSTFADVPAGHWAHGHIEALYTAGVISGDGTGQFRPQDPVTREELAIMLVKALYKNPTNTGLTLNFADADQIHDYAKTYVQTAVDHGLMRGDGTNFNPQQKAKRQEVAVIITNASKGDQNQVATIESVEDGNVTINGVSYTTSDALKGLFTESNREILTGAVLKFEATNDVLTKVTALEIKQGGEAAQAGADEFSGNLVFDGQNGKIEGSVKVSANYVTLKNLTLTGDLEITEQLQNDFYSDRLQVDGKTIVNGGDTNTVVFNNAKLTGMEINKSQVRVEPLGNTTLTAVTINADANLTAGAGVVIPKLTVAEHAANVEINATVDALEITSDQATTLTGKADIKALTVASTNGVELNTTGKISKLEATDKAAKLTIKAGAKVDNLVLPEGAKASDVIQNYTESKGQFTNINNEKNPDAPVVTPPPVSTDPTTPPPVVVPPPVVITPPPSGDTTPPPVVNVQVTGKAVTETGTPVANATIRIFNHHANFETTVVTDAQGVYKVSGLTVAGTYQLRAIPPATETNLVNSLVPQIQFDPTYNGSLVVEDLVLYSVDVKGQILNHDGTAVNYPSLIVSSMQGYPTWSFEIDQQGNYKIGGLQEGREYEVVATPPYGADAAKSPIYRIVPQADQGVLQQELRLSEVKVEGTVVSPNGIPVQAVDVLVYEISTTPGQISHREQTFTESNGKFKMGNFKVGAEYRVTLTPSFDSPYVKPATSTFIYDGTRMTLPALQLAEPNVVGTVYLEPGVKATNTNIEVKRQVNSSANYFDTLRTNENGQFRMYLPDGTYTFKAFSGPVQTDYADSAPLTVTVSGGVPSVSTPEITMARPMVKGLIQDDQGRMFSSGIVELWDANNRLVVSDQPDFLGNFVLGNVPDGTYTLKMRVFADSTLTFTPVPVTIVNQTPVNLGTLRMERTAVQIAGRVLMDGQPLTNGNVGLYDQNKRHIRSVQPSAEGRYQFGGLQAGNYFINAMPPIGDENWVSSGFIPVTYTDQLVQVPDVAVRQVQLRGQVLNFDGTPVKGATAGFAVSDGVTSYVDDNGGFRLVGLVEGREYTIYPHLPVEPDNVLRPEPVKFTYTAQTTLLNIQLVQATLTGQIVSPDGIPLMHSFVTVRPVDDSTPMVSYTTWDQGKFKFGNLIVGKEYELIAAPPGGIDAWDLSAPVRFIYDGTPINLGQIPLQESNSTRTE